MDGQGDYYNLGIELMVCRLTGTGHDVLLMIKLDAKCNYFDWLAYHTYIMV